MVVFISWSGKRSKLIAKYLHDWLPNVLQFIEPWSSFENVNLGEFWVDHVRDNLGKAQFAIICLTKENMNSPWLNYEAGAIAERLDGKVCPYLFEMSTDDLKDSPLRFLQVARVNEEDTLKLLSTLNSTAKKLGIGGLDEGRISKTLGKFWEEYETFLHSTKELHDFPENNQKYLQELAEASSLKGGFLAVKKIVEELSKTAPIEHQSKLRNIVTQFSSHLVTLDEILDDFTIWNEASIWFEKKWKCLVDVAIDKCLIKHPELKNSGRSLDSDEKVSKFRENVDNHIGWIRKLLEKKTIRIPLTEHPVISDRLIYKEVFLYLIEEVGNCNSLSKDAKDVVVECLSLLVKEFSI